MAMTTEEAGRRGGLAVKKKYGPSFYSETGNKEKLWSRFLLQDRGTWGRRC